MGRQRQHPREHFPPVPVAGRRNDAPYFAAILMSLSTVVIRPHAQLLRAVKRKIRTRP
jgi:hypothetical protein